MIDVVDGAVTVKAGYLVEAHVVEGPACIIPSSNTREPSWQCRHSRFAKGTRSLIGWGTVPR
jgi:hypothetical protein